MYIPRALTKSLKSASRAFYVILLTGRQIKTGKILFIKYIMKPNIKQNSD